MQKASDNITVFLLITTFLIMLMGVFILTILFAHRRKQIAYLERIKEIEANYEKNILQTQLEIQEQTFQHISQEIHDNISLSLTLAKLNLNTLDWTDKQRVEEKIESSVDLLSKSIIDLRNISQGLNADIIFQQGLLKAVEDEIFRIRQADPFKVEFELKGIPVYLDHKKELVIFRIIQEAFNNIIKHAEADKMKMVLHYHTAKLDIHINDDGLGFDTRQLTESNHAGLRNMETRVKMLNGSMQISSQPGKGTSHLFTIPFD